MTGQSHPMTVEVLPGSSTFHVTDGLMVLGTKAVAEASDGFFDRLCEHQSVPDALEHVLAMPLGTVPPFGIVSWSAGSVHLVVRGNVHAQIFPRDADPFQVDGTGLLTWCEQSYEGIDAVALTSDPPATPTEPTIVAGPRVQGSWARCATDGLPSIAANRDAPTGVALVDVPEEHQQAPPIIERPSHDEPVSAASPHQPRAPEPSTLAAVPTPAAPAAEGVRAVAPVPPTAPSSTEIHLPEEATAPVAAPAPSGIWPPPPPEAGSALEREMLELLGATTTAEALRNLAKPTPEVTPAPPGSPGEHVAPAPILAATTGWYAEEDQHSPPAPTRHFHEGAADPPPTIPPISTAPPTAPSPAMPAAPIGVATHMAESSEPTLPPARSGLIQGVPGMASPPSATPTHLPPPVPPAPSAAPSRHDRAVDPTAPAPAARTLAPPAIHDTGSFTPQSAQPIPPAQEMPPSTDPLPMVKAVRCGSGHPNAPYASECRTCNAPIDDRTVGTLPRPAMGWLLFTDGHRIQITRPLLLGRNPSGVTHTPDGEPLANVPLPDPGQVLSRTHAEVRILDWQVQVIDRDSRNGTFVTIPGRPTFRLHPGEPYPLPAGASVTLGESTGFSYSTSDI